MAEQAEKLRVAQLERTKAGERRDLSGVLRRRRIRVHPARPVVVDV